MGLEFICRLSVVEAKSLNYIDGQTIYVPDELNHMIPYKVVIDKDFPPICPGVVCKCDEGVFCPMHGKRLGR